IVSQSFTSQKRNRQKNLVKQEIINSTEQELKIQRINRITEEETKMSDIKLQKENNLLVHEQLVQKLTIEHMKQIHKLEYREAEAKTQLSELRLQRETNMQ
ncbi:uncharacterized protein, partial [Mycetomoellerius zeteki]|uniref:uncharacterized protein n=1 Tax=Mycetomoellerius zeteki TaxID=64791 RepID=UPI00084E4E66